MKKVLIINGPNLNLIGTRETEIYGNISFDEIKNDCIKKGKENNIEIVASLPCYQEDNVNDQRGKGVFKKSIKVRQIKI